MKTNKLILGLLAIFILPLASAVELNNSIINATGLPLQINITSPIYFDTLIVNESWIYFDDLRASDTAVETLDVNLTQAGNYTEGSLPYYSASSSTSKTISNGLAFSVNGTGVVSVDSCSFDSVKYQTLSPTYSCSTNLVITLDNIPNGNSIIEIDYTTDTEAGNDLMKSKFLIFLVWIPILLVCFLAFTVMKIVKGEEFDSEQFIAFLMMIIGSVIVVIVAMIIMGEIRF